MSKRECDLLGNLDKYNSQFQAIYIQTSTDNFQTSTDIFQTSTDNFQTSTDNFQTSTDNQLGSNVLYTD